MGVVEPLSLTRHRELRAADLVAVREQLGREPTTPFVVVCRCTGGHPLVIRNAPLDANGDPFPTTFWLTCPTAVKAVARLESEGWIARLNERAVDDEAFGVALEAAHEAYAVERARDLPEARDWGGVAGTRTGVKCLHAHYAYHLAGGEDPVGAWVAARIAPVHPEERGGRVAAIDQGTNSCRLIVLEPGEPPLELARDMVITRLGQGVDRTGRLDPDALARTVEVLAGFCRRARALGVGRIRVAATSAVRDAENRDAFAAAVAAYAGSALEIVTGEQEAGLSYLGGTLRARPQRGPRPVPRAGHRRRVDRVRDGLGARTRRARGLHADGERPADRAARARRPSVARGPRGARGRGRARGRRGGADGADRGRPHARGSRGHGHDAAGDRARPRPVRPRPHPPDLAHPRGGGAAAARPRRA